MERPIFLLSLAALICGAVVGCHIDIDEEKPNRRPDSGYHYEYREVSASSLPAGWSEDVDPCEQEDKSDRACFENDEARWLTSCKTSLCQAVPVKVHYMLSEDLGGGNLVYVEAFDNPRFSGNPISTVYMTNFSAREPGDRGESVVFLDPGEYYFRAYIGHDEQTASPYQYQGMELVRDRPMGVHGALSSVTKLTVQARAGETPVSPVDIYLDKLFKKPEAERETRAFLRALVTLDPSFEVPLNRTVVIQLHESSDFAFHPVYRFTLPSENLRVEGRTGTAEFLSPELKEGSYYILAYLDLSSNGYLDQGEPYQIHQVNGETAKVKILGNRTETVRLELAEQAER